MQGVSRPPEQLTRRMLTTPTESGAKSVFVLRSLVLLVLLPSQTLKAHQAFRAQPRGAGTSVAWSSAGKRQAQIKGRSRNTQPTQKKKETLNKSN